MPDGQEGASAVRKCSARGTLASNEGGGVGARFHSISSSETRWSYNASPTGVVVNAAVTEGTEFDVPQSYELVKVLGSGEAFFFPPRCLQLCRNVSVPHGRRSYDCTESDSQQCKWVAFGQGSFFTLYAT